MMGEEKKEGEEGEEEEGEWCCVKQTNQTNACQPHIPTIILPTSALPCMTTRSDRAWPDGVKGRT